MNLYTPDDELFIDGSDDLDYLPLDDGYDPDADGFDPDDFSDIDPAPADAGFTNRVAQRVVLAALDCGEPDFEQSLAELRELTRTAGGDVIAEVTQKLSAPVAGTCFGSGRLAEIAEFCRNDGDIDLVIVDRELSPIQLKNIEKETGVRTIDRTMLILDIFAQRARSSEGKLQVELAQLKYMLPRLTGKGVEMSRLGGGIGTRGPGESRLETDRRHIRRRIDVLRGRLDAVAGRRELRRKRRRKDGVVTAALVGYTNAGKSTLLNRLTGSEVFAQDMLFATLDPTMRALRLPSGGSVTLVDTVGFIRRLPHHLVEAFKSTLEEALDADVLLVLCDGSDPDFRSQLEVSRNLLSELGAGGKPTVTVINKCDKAPRSELLGMSAVRISALTGEGLDALLAAIEEALPDRPRIAKMMFPFNALGDADTVRRAGEVQSEEYTADGLELVVLLDRITAARMKQYITGGDFDFSEPEEE